MRKKRILFFITLMIFCSSGCGERDADAVPELQWETVDRGEEGAGPGSGDQEETSGAAKREGKTAEAGGGTAPSIEGLIEEQSFEVELDGWGKVFFASIEPAGIGGAPHFALMKNGETVYEFPEKEEAAEGFCEVCAVAFQDYNQDGKKDAAVLVTYSDGEKKWNEPMVFLQENPDNMFYLDHPELEGYQVKRESKAGPAFYRDTFLEEYLSRQQLTDTLYGLSDSWADYVDYADSLQGSFSAEKQLEIFARNRELWTAGMDYANDRHCFTVAGLTYDGRLTLIAANQGGTGRYTYSEFYQVDEKGELKRLETSFSEGDSQPDLMVESMTVYCDFSLSGMRNQFVVHDEVRNAADDYLYRTSALSLSDDFVLETPLAEQRVIYAGEDHSPEVTGSDCRGNALTKEEYDSFPDTYYGSMGLTRKTARFEWIDVSRLEGAGDEEAENMLRQAYEGFSLS